MKNQVLLFLSSWEPNLSDLMVLIRKDYILNEIFTVKAVSSFIYHKAVQLVLLYSQESFWTERTIIIKLVILILIDDDNFSKWLPGEGRRGLFSTGTIVVAHISYSIYTIFLAIIMWPFTYSVFAQAWFATSKVGLDIQWIRFCTGVGL